MTDRKFYGMKNDFMFHAVLQTSETVLKGLVSALMDIPAEEIKSCRVENPIDYGRAVEMKEIILDVKITLNDSSIINIEMQVECQEYWPDRSLLYWARSYDILRKGEPYEKLKRAFHIGILDFTLFKERPEFYSEYMIYNSKTGVPYTDKLCIRILDLTKVELAADTPQEQELVRWARAFNAESMEELERVCAGKEVLEEMAVTLKKLSADEEIRMQCEARERYLSDMASQYEGGFQKGLNQGLNQGRFQDIQALMHNLNISWEEAERLLTFNSEQ